MKYEYPYKLYVFLKGVHNQKTTCIQCGTFENTKKLCNKLSIRPVLHWIKNTNFPLRVQNNALELLDNLTSLERLSHG